MDPPYGITRRLPDVDFDPAIELDYRMEDLWLEADAAATKRLTPEQRSYFGDTFDVLGGTDSLCAWDRVWNRGVAMMDWSWRDRSRHPHRHTSGCGNCW